MSGTRFEINRPEVERILMGEELKGDMEDFTRDLWNSLPTPENYTARVELRNKRWRSYIISTRQNAVNYEAKYGELSALTRKRNI
jgi:hypothetical protein